MEANVSKYTNAVDSGKQAITQGQKRKGGRGMREGWEYKKLGDSCVIEYGTRVVQKKDGGTIYPVYGGGGETFRMDKYNRENCLVVARFAMSRTCVRYVTGKFFLNDSGLSINAGKELLQSYLNHHILHLNDDIYNLGKGAAQRNLDVNSFRNLIIPVPPLSTQLSIVSELDKINELIRLKKEQLRDYDNLAQSIFYEMFGDPVANEKGWEVKHIGDFGTCIAGATPSTTVEEYWINGTIPWLSSGEVSKGRIFNTDRRITQHGYDSCSTRMIPAHTIVIAMAGQGKTRGTVGVAEIPLCTNQSICSIVTNENIDVDFLYYQIKFLYNELRSASNGDGGRGGLNLRLIQKFPIISPNYSLQVSFAKRIKTVELLKSNIQSTIADLETLLASRMQYWFD